MKKKNEASSIISWIGNKITDNNNSDINEIKKRNQKYFVSFYSSCFYGSLKLNIGDFVLISNADAAYSESLTECCIGQILYMYELINNDSNKKDPNRAIISWYSRCRDLPPNLDGYNNKLDPDLELIQDLRPYDNDISLETIFNKCTVFIGDINNSPNKLLPSNNNYLMYICRYKLIRIGRKYTLVPLLQHNNNCDEKNKSILNKKKNQTPTKFIEKKTPKGNKKNDYCVVKIDDVLSDKNQSKYKITPLKIIKTNINTIKNKTDIENCLYESSDENYDGNTNIENIKNYYEPNENHLIESQTIDKNISPLNNSGKARRKLILDNENAILNYSIIEKQTPENDNINIKLRVSNHTKEIISNNKSNLENNKETINLRRSARKRSVDSVNLQNEQYLTPQKIKNCTSNEYQTPTSSINSRRRSILKDPSSIAENYGTPKKNIKLSDIVEEYLPNNKRVLRTPHTTKKKHLKDDSSDDEAYCNTPKSKGSEKKKTILKTPQSTKKRASLKPVTPSSTRKLINEGKITPSIAKKEMKTNTRKSDLQLTRERLHVAATPKCLPCREQEFDNIYSFLERKINDQSGGCMYVSGVPGTGKTATVTEVIRCLREESKNSEISEFQYVELNGMRLTEPQQAYVQIYRQLTGKTVAWKQAYNLLQIRFTTHSPKRLSTVLLIDELDIICNRRQDVVYNLLDWSTKTVARLTVITIANTMDLPERMLLGKVTSRLGLTRLTFLPYTFKQLQEIVTSRLAGSDSFKSDAVQLVARKIAAVSGDARRALDICRRATEIAEDSFIKANTKSKSDDAIVSLVDVQQALNEMISSGKMQAIKNCSKLEKLFLQSVSAEIIRTGVEETNFLSVFTQLESLVAFSDVTLPCIGIVMKACSKLGEIRLLICEHSRNDIYRKILLNVSCDDIHFALQTSSN